MKEYANKLKEYLDKNPMHYVEGDSLLEELHWCYMEANTYDNAELRRLFQQLYDSLPELPEEKFDDVFNIVCGLSLQHEKLAFQTGAKVGFYLAAELFG